MGTVRFALAILVVVHHLGAVPYIGQHAVYFFYVMSGYLMTLIMQERYRYSMDGIVNFWQNRILRLYPSYLIVIALTFILLLVIDDQIGTSLNWALFTPSSGTEWFSNITMIFPKLTPNEVGPRLAPATWALTVELCFYFLISIGLSKTKRRVIVWVCASLAYLVACLALGAEKKWFYFSIFAGSLPFSIGALIYFYRDQLSQYIQQTPAPLRWRWFAIACALFVTCIATRIWMNTFPALTYISITVLSLTTLPAAMMIIALINGGADFINKKLDKLLGDLSFPIYICHYTIAIAVSAALGIGTPAFGHSGLVLFTISLPLILLMSWGLVKLVDQPIEKYRTKIRNRSIVRANDRDQTDTGALVTPSRA